MLKKIPYEAIILGVEVCITEEERVLTTLLEKWTIKAKNKPFWIVTAYSETFLENEANFEFAKAISEANLIVADGVSVVAAADFLNRKTGNFLKDLQLGLKTGLKIFRGSYTNRVTGIALAKKLLSREGKTKKVFLLGGKNGVAGQVAEKVKKANPELQLEWEEGPKDISYQLSGYNYQLAGNSNQSSEIIEKINKFAPEVLLVALGRYKQEIWIAQYLKQLNAGVVIGVGSVFDELAGEGYWATPIPDWVSARGLKWLWRAIYNPKHWPRVFRAVVVFPWRVWKKG